jgi:hypothetical protein
VFTVGIGSPDGPRDREVLGITAGDPRLDHATVDLHVTTMSSGFGRAPFSLRILANGQVLDTRRLVPSADGSPIEQVFTVAPDPLNATVYTAEIPRDDAEAVAENNSRSLLVSPAGRKRRLLLVEGAPGFEHSFMTRALAADPGLEIDSVTRKGKNGDGQDTFFIQAGGGRSANLTFGFPATREHLYLYDALVIACGALAHEIAALRRLNGWEALDVQCLPPELHNHPEQIPGRVREAIAAAERDEEWLRHAVDES